MEVGWMQYDTRDVLDRCKEAFWRLDYEGISV